MLNRSYHTRARKIGPIGMESVGQIIGRLALGALAESAQARKTQKRKNVKTQEPEQLELFSENMNQQSQITIAVAQPADRPLTEEELWQEFNRLFPENPCLR